MIKFKAEYDGKYKEISLELEDDLFYEKREEVFVEKWGRWVWKVVEGKCIHTAIVENGTYDQETCDVVENYLSTCFNFVEELEREL